LAQLRDGEGYKMVRVKICGVRSAQDVVIASECGADAVGVLVGQRHRSEHFVSIEVAKSLFAQTPPFLTRVIVTHASQVDEIMSICTDLYCDVVQLHSDLSLSVLATLRTRLQPRRIIGKVSVEDGTAVHHAVAIAPLVDAIVLDSIDRTADRVGGTGLTHNWDVSAKIVHSINVPVILAGGLTPANVEKAIRIVKPWAVDVNTGVQGADGFKTQDLVRAFIANARGCDYV
jgi:phosphoribosylanthranilate isomerase